MYEYIQRGLSVLYTLTNWAKEMQQREEKITKNLYTQCKAYLLNVFLLKNNFTKKISLYYTLHVTERTVMLLLLVIVSLLVPFISRSCVLLGGREGQQRLSYLYPLLHPLPILQFPTLSSSLHEYFSDWRIGAHEGIFFHHISYFSGMYWIEDVSHIGWDWHLSKVWSANVIAMVFLGSILGTIL